MDKKILNEFIDKICDMTGMECYEEELDNHVGKIELRFGDQVKLVYRFHHI